MRLQVMLVASCLGCEPLAGACAERLAATLPTAQPIGSWVEKSNPQYDVLRLALTTAAAPAMPALRALVGAWLQQHPMQVCKPVSVPTW